MKKKIIFAILVTALAVTSFTGCGKAQDKDTAEVIMAETETRDLISLQRHRRLWTLYCRRRRGSR